MSQDGDRPNGDVQRLLYVYYCAACRNAFGEELPIIFVSGTGTEPLARVAGLLIGADDYVVEPSVPGELVAGVRRALARVKFARRTRASGAWHVVGFL